MPNGVLGHFKPEGYSDAEKFRKGMKHLNYALNEMYSLPQDPEYIKNELSTGISLLSELRHNYEDEERAPDPASDNQPGI